MRLRPDSSINPVNGEIRAADGGKLGAFSRGFHRLWWGFFEMPEDVVPASEVADIADARERAAAAAAGPAAGPEGVATEGVQSGAGNMVVSPGAEGQVVDMEKHRMAREAREEIERLSAEAAAAPEPPGVEDMF